MTAIISPCGLYRYRLERDLGGVEADPNRHVAVAFVMLNPSTADAERDDPTIRRCIGYARRWGYGKLIVGNAYAWRSTDPAGLWTAPDPVGPDNDQHIKQIARDADLVVCAWGAHASADRARRVYELITSAGRQPRALTLTKAGAPGHPLRLRADLRPVPWTTC